MDDHFDLDDHLLLDAPCSCLWCVCWTSFFTKCSRCDLVMDDYHGRTRLNLDPHQLLLLLLKKLTLSTLYLFYLFPYYSKINNKENTCALRKILRYSRNNILRAPTVLKNYSCIAWARLVYIIS